MISRDTNDIARDLNATLLVVLPVYNEEESIAEVIREWRETLLNLRIPFQIIALDDGSRDRTREILLQLRTEYPDILQVVSKSNSGHGTTCRAGYEIAVRSRADWVLQIDSDGQCDTGHFAAFWESREKYDCIFGVRGSRDDGTFRVIASWFCRLFSSLIFGRDLKDPNVPYRLIRRNVLEQALPDIPADFNIQNVALTGVLKTLPGLRWNYVDIHFRRRHGGKPSAGLLKMLRSGFGMLLGLVRMRLGPPRSAFSFRQSIVPAADAPR